MNQATRDKLMGVSVATLASVLYKRGLRNQVIQGVHPLGWKGKNMGAAGVYDKQALVLVNHGGASGADIAQLAKAIQDDVMLKFGVALEPEPVFI